MRARIDQLQVNCFYAFWAGWNMKDKTAVLKLYKEAPSVQVVESIMRGMGNSSLSRLLLVGGLVLDVYNLHSLLSLQTLNFLLHTRTGVCDG